VGSIVIDLFSQHFGRVGDTTRTDFVGVDSGFHGTPRKIAYRNSSKILIVIQRLDQKL